jgi:hypothetical protein
LFTQISSQASFQSARAAQIKIISDKCDAIITY